MTKKSEPIILCFDTSSDRLVVAVGRGATMHAGFQSSEPSRHSESLIQEIGNVLKKAKLKISEVDVVGVGAGPGSFTGLRIAFACASMMIFSLKAKAVSFSSLDAIVESYSPQAIKVAVALDAKRSQLYVASYEFKNNWRCMKKPSIVSVDALAGSASRGSIWVGGAAQMYRDAILSAGNDFSVDEHFSATLTAASLYACAVRAVSEKQFVTPSKLLPMYLHPKDCNVTRKK